MRIFAAILCCCIAGLIIAGCGEYPSNDSANNPYNRYPNLFKSRFDGGPITDPYYWARLRFTEGGVLADGASPEDFPICYASGDINHDGQDELFIRDDAMGAKIHCVMVFSKNKNGYKFLGHFNAGTVILTDMVAKGAIIAGPPAQQKGTIWAYFYDTNAGKLIYDVSPWPRPIVVGKGATAESNKYYDELIKNGKTLQWTEY